MSDTSDLRWFDSHCHLGSDAAEAIARARAAGVVGIITVGTDLEESRAAIDTAHRFDDVWATAGVHPHEARFGMDGIVELLDDEVVVAVGEAGLDFHYEYSPRGVQSDVFAAQVALANERGMPLVVHSREAWEETFAVLDAEGVPDRTV
ncbi:MAG: TatD family hydrolase, partial [Actinomycetota bacterium]|nr:TatD family hydrolase [Actinomycetota bacterium]